MLRTISPICLLLWCAVAIGQPKQPTFSKGETLFVAQVLPTFQAKCFACHGDDAKKMKAALDMRSLATLLKGGDSGPALIAGKSQESLIYKAAIRTDHEVSAMPPKENDRLSKLELETLQQWIDAGAPWPDAAQIKLIQQSLKPKGVTVHTSGGLSEEWTNRRYQPADLWAYQPLKKVQLSQHGSQAIDHLIDERIRSAGINAAPRADRRTLIRRVTFDLTGLPPTPHEIQNFLTDNTSDEVAFRKVVDRLLASPHFGEQFARHWLDIARYADSAGFANDYERGNAWRYRDYVVRAFNNDKPYDQFVREQIAGDEIDTNNPEMLIATGFLRMGAWELTGMEVARIARQRFLDDVTDTVSQVFLGHMAQCARCHDHKFDPVPTRDYYRLQAVFATTQIAECAAPFLPKENTQGFEEQKYLQARKQFYQDHLNRIQKIESAKRIRWEKENPDQKGIKFPRHQVLSAADLGMERIARKGLERLRWEEDRYEPIAHSVYNGKTPELRGMYAPFRMPTAPLEGKGTLDNTFILAGGDPFSPKEKVLPGAFSAALPDNFPQATSGRRTALANWIVDPANPLTARVIVNRLWQWVMGTPIAGNPNNFGATGKKPTHPELLDWLAAELIRQQWSMKQMIRMMVLTDTYARMSQHPNKKELLQRDPNLQLYAVHRPRRLTAEELHDAILATSGELNAMVGGIPVRHEINRDIAVQPRQVMGTFANVWEASPKPAQRNRRSIYTLKLRGLRDPTAEVFNQPSPEFSCERREVSTIAPQAFSLFNSEASRTRALVFAANVLKKSKSKQDAVQQIFQRALGRTPTETEQQACLEHWHLMAKKHEAIPVAKPTVVKEIVREAVEENVGQKYTFVEKFFAAADYEADLHPADVTPDVRGLMEVCLVLLNTNEFIYLD
ncbi:MAG: PSD1 and planctomycete cytochrome C domain-containing protein [Zavarzinella sp.]